MVFEIVESGIWATGSEFPGGPPSSAGTYDYAITITDPNFYFDKALISWVGPMGSSASTQFFTDASFTTSAPGFPTIATNATGPVSLVPLPSGFTTLFVRTTYSPGMELALNGFTQAQVPAPLPVLGAGAAFGFSRRLRRRIQQSQKKLG